MSPKQVLILCILGLIVSHKADGQIFRRRTNRPRVQARLCARGSPLCNSATTTDTAAVVPTPVAAATVMSAQPVLQSQTVNQASVTQTGAMGALVPPNTVATTTSVPMVPHSTIALVPAANPAMLSMNTPMASQMPPSATTDMAAISTTSSPIIVPQQMSPDTLITTTASPVVQATTNAPHLITVGTPSTPTMQQTQTQLPLITTTVPPIAATTSVPSIQIVSPTVRPPTRPNRPFGFPQLFAPFGANVSP